MLKSQHSARQSTFSVGYWHTTPLMVYTSDSDAQELTMTQGTVQLVAGILAVILIGIVIMRRKGGKKKEEDDF
jgi:hypothetical protein